MNREAHERRRGDTGCMVESTGSPEPMPGMDPDEPVPDSPAELTDPEETLPPPPIEATPDDPGGDPGEQPAPA